MRHSNPFVHVSIIPPDQFSGRDDILNPIESGIKDGRESFMITGSSRCGKTSLLNYLRCEDDPGRKATYSKWVNKLIFSYVDVPSLETYNQAQFWEYVLTPLQEELERESTPLLSQAYQACQTANFNQLEKLFSQMKHAKWRLVLMLDGFDALLGHPFLDNQTFFGKLRSQVTTSQGALVLITMANAYLPEIFSHTRFTGSPFNILTEKMLGSLPEAEIDKLLRQGDEYFTDIDYCFLKKIAGGHPYLLQLAASVLWQIYEKEGKANPVKNQQSAERDIYSQTKNTLETFWQALTVKTERLKVFTSVALIHLATLPSKSLTLTKSMRFHLIDNINRLTSECEELEKSGFIVYSKMHDSWQVLPRVFLTFVEAKLKQEVSGELNESSYENWLISQKSEAQNAGQQPSNLDAETKASKRHPPLILGEFISPNKKS